MDLRLALAITSQTKLIRTLKLKEIDDCRLVELVID